MAQKESPVCPPYRAASIFIRFALPGATPLGIDQAHIGQVSVDSANLAPTPAQYAGHAIVARLPNPGASSLAGPPQQQPVEFAVSIRQFVEPAIPAANGQGFRFLARPPAPENLQDALVCRVQNLNPRWCVRLISGQGVAARRFAP